MYMNKLKPECKMGTSGCIYLDIKRLCDISGKDFQVWYCKCEDVMCASCIPEYD